MCERGEVSKKGDKGLAAFLFVLCAVYVTVYVCVRVGGYAYVWRVSEGFWQNICILSIS